MRLSETLRKKIEGYKAIDKVEEVSAVNAVESLASVQSERTYYDRVFDELGDEIRAVEKAISAHNSKTNQLMEVLRSQGHLKEGKRRTSFDGKVVNTKIWSEKAEEILAKFRYKRRLLEDELQAAKNRINLGFSNLIGLAQALDRMDYIKERELAYFEVNRKICELIPLMDEMFNYDFDLSSDGSYNTELSIRWQSFVRDFIKVKPQHLNERILRRAFEVELVEAKEQLNNRKRLKSVSELVDEL